MPETGDSFFVVLEGLDGAGKTEISRRLRRVLAHTHGKNIDLTFEPYDPSAAGLFIRQVLTRRVKVHPRTLALAFALNRADHNDRVIGPFLEGKERIMLCDRYYLSSLVYQAVPPLTIEDVMDLNKDARRPDLILFLSVSAKTGYERMSRRTTDKELFERNLEESRQKYHEAIAFLRERGETVIEIEADGTIEEVLNAVLDAIVQHGPNWLRVQRPLVEEMSIDTPPKIISGDDTRGQNLIDQLLPPAQLDLSGESAHIQARIRKLHDDLNAKIETLAYPQLVTLFSGLLERQGYCFGERLPWTDMAAYQAEYVMPLNVVQYGTALLLDHHHRHESITKTIQTLSENSDFVAMNRLSDFMLVLDPEPTHHEGQVYERGTDGAAYSPSIRILNRRDIAGLLLADVVSRLADQNPDIKTLL